MDTNTPSAEMVTAVGLGPVPPKPERLESVDLVRGLAMILMALDHVRDFWSDRLLMDPTDLGTTTAGIFLTRWVTHFCAPTFIFLAGTSAFLAGTRGRSKGDLSWFLFTRGLWLAFFEVTVNRALWMFNYDLQHYGAGVFWAIGWAMVVLAVLVYLPTSVTTLVGVALIASHNLLDGVRAQHLSLPEWLWIILHQPGDGTVARAPGWLWDTLHSPGHVPGSDDITFGTGYCLIPWTGVMAAGYGFGALLRYPRARRRRLVFLLGGAVTLAFVLLRAWDQYGDPRPWQTQSSLGWTVLSFLLKNGNTLIASGGGTSVVEVSREGKVVWEIKDAIPDAKVTLKWTTFLTELDSGNIIVGNCHAGEKSPQLFEITRDKKVRWQFNRYDTFGNGLACSQVLNDQQSALVRKLLAGAGGGR